jgi:tagatose-1,6-bisphosphate aldolase
LNENAKLSSDEKRRVVVETARRLSPLHIDILKSEFPLDIHDPDESRWKDACVEISAASVTPWILLSAAVEFETFIHQVSIACNAGSCGIAVGRAVWQEAVLMNGEKRLEFLQTIARERLSRLTSLCLALARPYSHYYSAKAPFDWYKSY